MPCISRELGTFDLYIISILIIKAQETLLHWNLSKLTHIYEIIKWCFNDLKMIYAKNKGVRYLFIYLLFYGYLTLTLFIYFFFLFFFLL